MAKERKEFRLQVRTTADQIRRIDRLREKKALDQSGIVNLAIKELFDREIGDLSGTKKKKGATQAE